MKTNEEMLERMLNKAEELSEEDQIEIPEESLTEASIEDLFNAGGRIYYHEGVLYRETEKKSGEWLFYKVEYKTETISASQMSSAIPEKVSPKLEEIENRVARLEKWAFDMKNYVDTIAKKLESMQDETLAEIKAYIDNQIKIHTHNQPVPQSGKLAESQEKAVLEKRLPDVTSLSATSDSKKKRGKKDGK